MDIVYSIATWLVPLVIAIVFHEVAHGYVARHFGDHTAERRGRLTLNPVRHVDPVGTVALPMMLAVAGAPIFGWAKAVPVNPARMRNPRWHMVLVALAGPGANLLLGAVALAALAPLLHLDYGVASFVRDNLFNFLVINVMLALFNLIPLPPFDGGHVLEGLLPRSVVGYYARLRKYGLLLAVALFVLLPMFMPEANLVGRFIAPPVTWIIDHALMLIGG